MDRSIEYHESEPAAGDRPDRPDRSERNGSEHAGPERAGHQVDLRPRRRRPRPTPDSPRHREDNDEAWVRALTGPPISAAPPGS